MNPNQQFLSAAVRAAKAGGRVIEQSFRQKDFIAYTYKDHHRHVVTKIDKAAERAVIAALKKTFPDHSFFSEEMGFLDQRSDYLWIIDPLDGTTNFTRKFPNLCVSIALTYKKIPLVGVIYQPLSGELYTAEAGRGARYNGKKIMPAKRIRSLQDALVFFNSGALRKERVRFGKLLKLLGPKVRSLRILGSAALDFCYAARGQCDAVVSIACMTYDCAAGVLIAKEAGVKLSDFQGKKWQAVVGRQSDLIAASPALYTKLLKTIQTFRV